MISYGKHGIIYCTFPLKLNQLLHFRYFPTGPDCGCQYPENPLALGRSKKPRPQVVPEPAYHGAGGGGGGGGNSQLYMGPLDSVQTVYDEGYSYDATGLFQVKAAETYDRPRYCN